MDELLRHRWVGDRAAPRAAFILHGILGSGRNWAGFARRWVRADPAWRLCLVDLRGHGESRRLAPPHTVEACADDLGTLAATVGAPGWVVGHSFGGKVALAYARLYGGLALRRVWSLDSPPGPSGPGPQGEVERVLDAVRAAPQPVPQRGHLRRWFLERGFSPELAGWMTTNLRPEGAGLVWRFDTAVVAELLADFRRVDLWPVIETPPAGVEIHVVQAARGDRWRPADLARISASPTHLHVLPEAGHWVHADDPEGLLAILRAAAAER